MIPKRVEWEQEPLLTTWTNDTNSDCCRWEEIKCNPTSGRVTRIGLSYLYLNESSLLNLSMLHPFEEVRSLNLKYSGFIGLFDDVEGYKSLRRLRKLEILDLSFSKFNNSIFPFLNAATSLTTLFLKSNWMDGPLHVKELRDLKNLEVLDLSENKFNCSIPVRELSSALRKLKALSLSGNKFSGSIELQGICELTNIQELDLSKNKLVGQFPICITNLSGIRVLDLSSNQLIWNVPSALANLESLEYLSLFHNNFEGLFSLGWLANLSKLKVLRLDSYTNSRRVELESSWKPKFQLSVISLGTGNLEKVPHFLQYQKDLRYVDLSNNNISGNFPSWLLENNIKLEVLLLQDNSFTSFQLPQSDHNLLYLDVSVNEFDQLFPQNIGWILPRLRYMNLTNNGFQGNLPSSLGNMEMIEFLDMSHNSFHGKIGRGLRSLRSLFVIDISNNNLTGLIPSWFDEFPDLSALQISNNLLKGEIPTSLFNLSNLQLLDLSANRLSGNIPQAISGYGALTVLLLQDNNLSGVIPDTMLAANVIVLDLRNNRLSGNIPEFINTKYIRILLLRGNNLSGRIPRQLCALRSIHLVDLANNRLNGSVPSCLRNALFGLAKEDTSYDYNHVIFSEETSYGAIFFKSLLMLDEFSINYELSTQMIIEFATKHRYDAYKSGNLKLLFGMDLSENELSGEIPVEFGDLLKLQALNLSHNNLSGVIPETFSGLKNVESLDLSFNRLQGRIPPELTELSSLAVFNVSFNNLSGVVPQGRQFNTLDTQSYFGNPFLCGQPTNTSCNSNNFEEPDNGVEADESTIDMVYFYWSFAAAYVTILLGILASLSFDSPWSRTWFYIVDCFIHKVRGLFW